MTITARTAGAWKAGSTSLASIALPASIAAGDMMVMFVGCKPYTATINTPSGWTKLSSGSGANGTTGSGTDSGSHIWQRISRVY